MRNRAKCALCTQVIESRGKSDYQTCPCGEISVWGEEGSYKCAATDFANFIRIDDEGNEIAVKVIEKDSVNEEKNEEPDLEQEVTKEEILKLFDDMVNDMEKMPEPALRSNVSHYDLLSLMLILKSLFKKL